MTAYPYVEIKPGETLSLAFQKELPTGHAWECACDVRDEQNRIVGEGVCTLVESSTGIWDGTISFSSTVTEGWRQNPSGRGTRRLYSDIKINDDSVPPIVVKTETFQIYVNWDVTQ